MDTMESVDRKRRRLLMERDDDNSPIAQASKKFKRNNGTTLSPVQQKLSEDFTTAPATDIETTLSTVQQQKLREELSTVQRKLSVAEELTLRMSFWLSQDQDWFSEERVRTKCLEERLQILLTENASLRERVKYLETDKISSEENE
jgi:cysteinyl-tRNA synthetase